MIGARGNGYISRLNRIGNATISTPIGNVGPVQANEIVRQGAIIRPQTMLYKYT